jgi:hypothetical protein
VDTAGIKVKVQRLWHVLGFEATLLDGFSNFDSACTKDLPLENASLSICISAHKAILVHFVADGPATRKATCDAGIGTEQQCLYCECPSADVHVVDSHYNSAEYMLQGGSISRGKRPKCEEKQLENDTLTSNAGDGALLIFNSPSSEEELEEEDINAIEIKRSDNFKVFSRKIVNFLWKPILQADGRELFKILKSPPNKTKST